MNWLELCIYPGIGGVTFCFLGWSGGQEGSLQRERSWKRVLLSLFPSSPPPPQNALCYIYFWRHTSENTWLNFFPLRKASIAFISLLWFSSCLRCWHRTELGVEINVISKGTWTENNHPFFSLVIFPTWLNTSAVYDWMWVNIFCLFYELKL